MKYHLAWCVLVLSQLLWAQPTNPNSILTHQTYLIALAHPDDETWLNGTLALLASLQKDIHIMYATSGGAGSDRSGSNLSGKALASKRELETRAALLALGLKTKPIFLQLADKHLKHSQTELEKQIQIQLSILKPDVVISFYKHGITGHKDHIQVANTISYAISKNNFQNIILYNVVVSTKRAAILNNISSGPPIKNSSSKPVTYLIKKPFNGNQKIEQISVAGFSKIRIDAFSSYPSQFPSSLQTIWKTFVSQTPYEEFIKP